MKSRMPPQLPPSSPSSTPGSAPLPPAASSLPPSSFPSLSSYHFPPPHASTSLPYPHLDGLGGLRSQGYSSLGGFPLPGGPYGASGYPPQGHPPRHGSGASHGSHAPSKVSSLKPIPADVKFEDYKDRPSDFLKVGGWLRDMQAGSGAAWAGLQAPADCFKGLVERLQEQSRRLCLGN